LLKEHLTSVDSDLTEPFEDLKNTQQIVPTGRGKFVYSGDFLKVFFSLDSCIKKFALEIGCKEELYPTTVKTSSLINSGYLHLHPQFAYFVAPAHLDLISLDKLTRKTILNRSERPETVANLGIPDQILSPTVCYHTFEARTNETLGSKQLVTALNKCYRHEPVNVQTLERLTTYWMREIIVFGDKKEVDRILSLAVDWTIEFLKKLGLGFSLVTASDPFFGSSGSSNRLLQSALELKRELIMPLSGNRKVAVASFNNHQQSLTKKFSIQFSKNSTTETPESGCIGWGYERLLYAIFSQLGTKIKDWPKKSKKILGI
jgi:seryl-tRNA synthetase